MQASVLTLVRGRTAHLANLMRGLARQETKPAELVIAWMQDEIASDLPDPGCPVRHLHVPGEPMPLARARNRAAQAARSDLLVFLDVDCIPSPTLIGAYLHAAREQSGVFLGEVLYLPEMASGQTLDYASLDRAGRVHPSKPPIPVEGVREEPNSGELWGLSFAIRRADWFALGGMDEDFVGYGGEETDFAHRIGRSGLKLFWTAHARAYHQHHPVHVPPLHQFDHILRNATRFHAKHGRWCMEYWLGQFAEAGYVDWHDDTSMIHVKRQPTEREIADTRRGGETLFS